MRNSIKCRVLAVGSSEEYGNVSPDSIPITEEMPLKPNSPYAIAKVSQEMLAKMYVESFGLDIVMTRSFNHIGPWQDERFVVPSFVKRILDIKQSGAKEGSIVTGNIEVVRDFLDVRDVISAYWNILINGSAGDVYNVCSGEGRSLKSVIAEIARQLDVLIDYKIDDSLVRPNENRIIEGSNEQIVKQIGWRRMYTFEQTIADIITYMIKEKR